MWPGALCQPLALQHSHRSWVLSLQVLVSYFLPHEDVPVATAILYLTGIGESPPPALERRVGLQRLKELSGGRGGSPHNKMPPVGPRWIHLLPMPLVPPSSAASLPPLLAACLILSTE